MIIRLYGGEVGNMPSKARRLEIEKIVNDIIKDNNLDMPGFDLIQFLTKVQGFKIALQPLPRKITGVLLIDDVNLIPNTNTNRLIAVNSALKKEENYSQRMRFICAHEYAHLILHKQDTDVQYAHRDTEHRFDPEEKEADFFARCLLMPAKLIQVLTNIEFIKQKSIDEKVIFFSKVFNVTPKKARQRLMEDLNFA